MTIVVTGAAGFIGHAVTRRLLESGADVVGIDDLNPYYDPALKRSRIAMLNALRGFRLVEADIADAEQMRRLIAEVRPDRVVHLAAQAGVRYSIEAPFAYERSNIAGHLSILEACRHAGTIEHLVYASSSSVYGDRPVGAAFREDDPADTPASLYAATKRSCELMSSSYSSLFGLRQTGLRFFTVYGPWGRPDMAYYIFARKIMAGEPIEVFGEGRMARDFTYIDDVVDGILGVLETPPKPAGHRILNIGDNRPVGLMDMINALERSLGRSAIKIMRPTQPGDVTITNADISRIKALTGYSPKVALEDGIERFAHWWLQTEGTRVAA